MSIQERKQNASANRNQCPPKIFSDIHYVFIAENLFLFLFFSIESMYTHGKMK
jgi:hypothetical protein